MTELEEHVNKLSNTLRILGTILVIAAAVSFVSISGTTATKDTLFLSFLFSLAVAGIVTFVVSTLTWRLVLKFGTSEKRMFYFYDSDHKKYR